MDSHNVGNDEQTQQRSSGSDSSNSQPRPKNKDLEALIRKHVERAIKSYETSQNASSASSASGEKSKKNRRPSQLEPAEPTSPSVSDVSPAIPFTAAPNWSLNPSVSITRSTTGASSRPSPPSGRDEQDGFPFPITAAPRAPAPDHPIPPRPRKGHAQLGSSMPDIPENVAQRRVISRNSGVPPTFTLPPPTSAPRQGSGASSDGQSSGSGDVSTAFVVKPYGHDDLDAFSAKSRPSGEAGNEDASSDIIRDPDAPGEQEIGPEIPDVHETATIRDSIQTLLPEQVQIGTAVQYASYGHKGRPVLKDVRASDSVPPPSASSYYASQNNSGYNSLHLPALVIPGQQTHLSASSPLAQWADSLVNPSATSQHSVSPVDGGATSSLGREPSDASMMRLGGPLRATSPVVRAHSRFSSRFDGSSPPPDRTERSVSRTSDVSNPFKDQSNPAEAAAAGAETQPYGTVATTNDLIKQSIKLATDVNRSTSSSGLADLEKEKPLNEQARRTKRATASRVQYLPHQDQTQAYPGAKELTTGSSQYRNDENDTLSQQPRRKCCGLPLWLFIVIILGVILIVAVAIIVPVAVVVIPHQNKAAPSPTATGPAQQIAICEKVSPCQNSGVSVLTPSGGCACVCTNDWGGTNCDQLGAGACTTFDTPNIVQATVGASIPPLLDSAERRYRVPLNASLLISLFSASGLSCNAEDTLVTFQEMSSRLLRRIPSLKDLQPSPPAPSMTPSPELMAFQIMERQQSTTVSGLVIEISSMLPTPTVASIASSSGGFPASSTSTPGFLPNSEKTLDYAGVVVLYIFQLTGAFDAAATAQSNLQSFFSSAAQQAPGSGYVNLGNGFTTSLATRMLWYNGQQIPG